MYILTGGMSTNSHFTDCLHINTRINYSSFMGPVHPQDNMNTCTCKQLKQRPV